jgi:tripartite-type tricarboxylate transporter receptor subunit TctC
MCARSSRGGDRDPGRHPEQFGNVIKAEVEKWGPIVKAAGITAD